MLAVEDYQREFEIAKRQLWEVVRRRTASGHAAVKNIACLVAANGEISVLYRGDDPEVDRLLHEAEAERSRFRANLERLLK